MHPPTSSLLRRGQKYTSQIKSSQKLKNAHQQLFNAMVEPRIRAYDNVSEGIIFRAGTVIADAKDQSYLKIPSQMENRSFILIVKQRSKHWEKMGRMIRGNLYVEAEEALLLFERGLLRLWVYEGAQWRRDFGEYLVAEEWRIREGVVTHVEQHQEEKRLLVEKMKEELRRDEAHSGEDTPSESTSTSNPSTATSASASAPPAMDYQSFLGLKGRPTKDEQNLEKDDINKFKSIKEDSNDLKHLKAACRPLFSVQDGFAFFISEVDPATQKPFLDIHHYLVYRYLKQTGYGVVRHNPENYDLARSESNMQKQRDSKISHLTRLSMRKKKNFSAGEPHDQEEAVQDLMRDAVVEGCDVEGEFVKADVEGTTSNPTAPQQTTQGRTFWDNSVTDRLPSLTMNAKSEEQNEENRKVMEEWTKDTILIRQLEDAKDATTELLPQLEHYDESRDLPPSLVGRSQLAQLPDNTVITQKQLRDTLQIIKSSVTEPAPDTAGSSLPSQWQIVYDVWRSDQKRIKNRTARPLPYCAVAITTYDSPFPTVEVIREWERVCGSVPVHVATLQGGTISFANAFVSAEIPDV